MGDVVDQLRGSVTADDPVPSVSCSGRGPGLGQSRLGQQTWAIREGQVRGQTVSTIISINESIASFQSEVMRLRTLDKSRRVRYRHGPVTGDGQQLLCCHGESVPVAMVMGGADREIEKVQFPVSQTLTENCGEINSVTHKQGYVIIIKNLYHQYHYCLHQ